MTVLAAGLLAPEVPAQREAEPAHAEAEADARAARRESMRQFAEALVAQVRTRLHEGIDYPPEALASRWEGTVWLAILYPWGGEAERITIHRTSGYLVLDSKALEIVQGMRLPARPDMLRGVEFDVTFPIGFRVSVEPGR